jgi:hypothetical protein|uniref:thiol oxidase n=1 Tax=viral metagenome TaxID=1070528 RepID=A0A6C0ELC5_9ZZZZ
MKYNPKIWGPHYWFFLFSVSLTYPHSPNNITKKKYYNLIRDFHLFIPDMKIGNEFNELIDIYPVTPYLDNRNSFVRWVNFIHNQINLKLNKPKVELKDALHNYYLLYIPEKKPFWDQSKLMFLGFIIFLLLTALVLYQK